MMHLFRKKKQSFSLNNQNSVTVVNSYQPLSTEDEDDAQEELRKLRERVKQLDSLVGVLENKIASLESKRTVVEVEQPTQQKRFSKIWAAATGGAKSPKVVSNSPVVTIPVTRSSEKKILVKLDALDYKLTMYRLNRWYSHKVTVHGYSKIAMVFGRCVEAMRDFVGFGQEEMLLAFGGPGSLLAYRIECDGVDMDGLFNLFQVTKDMHFRPHYITWRIPVADVFVISLGLSAIVFGPTSNGVVMRIIVEYLNDEDLKIFSRVANTLGISVQGVASSVKVPSVAWKPVKATGAAGRSPAGNDASSYAGVLGSREFDTSCDHYEEMDHCVSDVDPLVYCNNDDAKVGRVYKFKFVKKTPPTTQRSVTCTSGSSICSSISAVSSSSSYSSSSSLCGCTSASSSGVTSTVADNKQILFSSVESVQSGGLLYSTSAPSDVKMHVLSGDVPVEDKFVVPFDSGAYDSTCESENKKIVVSKKYTLWRSLYKYYSGRLIDVERSFEFKKHYDKWFNADWDNMDWDQVGNTHRRYVQALADFVGMADGGPLVNRIMLNCDEKKLENCILAHNVTSLFLSFGFKEQSMRYKITGEAITEIISTLRRSDRQVCGICLDHCYSVTRCGHPVHANCLKGWVLANTSHGTCYVCRQNLLDAKNLSRPITHSEWFVPIIKKAYQYLVDGTNGSDLEVKSLAYSMNVSPLVAQQQLATCLNNGVFYVDAWRQEQIMDRWGQADSKMQQGFMIRASALGRGVDVPLPQPQLPMSSGGGDDSHVVVDGGGVGVGAGASSSVSTGGVSDTTSSVAPGGVVMSSGGDIEDRSEMVRPEDLLRGADVVPLPLTLGPQINLPRFRNLVLRAYQHLQFDTLGMYVRVGGHVWRNLAISLSEVMGVSWHFDNFYDEDGYWDMSNEDLMELYRIWREADPQSVQIFELRNRNLGQSFLVEEALRGGLPTPPIMLGAPAPPPGGGGGVLNNNGVTPPFPLQPAVGQGLYGIRLPYKLYDREFDALQHIYHHLVLIKGTDYHVTPYLANELLIVVEEARRIMWQEIDDPNNVTMIYHSISDTVVPLDSKVCVHVNNSSMNEITFVAPHPDSRWQGVQAPLAGGRMLCSHSPCQGCNCWGGRKVLLGVNSLYNYEPLSIVRILLRHERVYSIVMPFEGNAGKFPNNEGNWRTYFHGRKLMVDMHLRGSSVMSYVHPSWMCHDSFHVVYLDDGEAEFNNPYVRDRDLRGVVRRAVGLCVHVRVLTHGMCLVRFLLMNPGHDVTVDAKTHTSFNVQMDVRNVLAFGEGFQPSYNKPVFVNCWAKLGNMILMDTKNSQFVVPIEMVEAAANAALGLPRNSDNYVLVTNAVKRVVANLNLDSQLENLPHLTAIAVAMGFTYSADLEVEMLNWHVLPLVGFSWLRFVGLGGYTRGDQLRHLTSTWTSTRFALHRMSLLALFLLICYGGRTIIIESVGVGIGRILFLIIEGRIPGFIIFLITLLMAFLVNGRDLFTITLKWWCVGLGFWMLNQLLVSQLTNTAFYGVDLGTIKLENFFQYVLGNRATPS